MKSKAHHQQREHERILENSKTSRHPIRVIHVTTWRSCSQRRIDIGKYATGLTLSYPEPQRVRQTSLQSTPPLCGKEGTRASKVKKPTSDCLNSIQMLR